MKQYRTRALKVFFAVLGLGTGAIVGLTVSEPLPPNRADVFTISRLSTAFAATHRGAGFDRSRQRSMAAVERDPHAPPTSEPEVPTDPHAPPVVEVTPFVQPPTDPPIEAIPTPNETPPSDTTLTPSESPTIEPAQTPNESPAIEPEPTPAASPTPEATESPEATPTEEINADEETSADEETPLETEAPETTASLLDGMARTSPLPFATEPEPMPFSADNERVVHTHAQLVDALTKDNGVNTVYLGSDIVVEAGIAIHTSKAELIVDGINPYDPTQTAPHVLTDFNSAAQLGTIHVTGINGTLRSLIVRNLTIVGKNYYGPFSVVNTVTTQNLVVTYQNIDYSGPQIGYHRGGLTRFIDVRADLNASNPGSTVAQEFGECKKFYFGGTNTIRTAAVAYSTFWMPLGGSFEIGNNSSLTVVSPDTSTAFGAFYATGIYDVSVHIGNNALFDITLSRQLATPGQVQLNPFTLAPDSTFIFRAATTTAFPTIAISGPLTLQDNARFEAWGVGGAGAMLEQHNGNIVVGKEATFHLKATGSYVRLLDLFGQKLLANDPASVVLHSPSSRVLLATTTAGGININAEQIGYWRDAGDGGIDNPALYRWKKQNDSLFQLSASLAIGTAGNFGSFTSNYTTGDSPGEAPNATNFQASPARVLSFGRLDLQVYPLTPSSEAVSGITRPGASVRASLIIDGTTYPLTDVTANSSGSFTIPLEFPITGAAELLVQCTYEYLYAEHTSTVSFGKLEFEVPHTLRFTTTPIASRSQTITRSNPAWQIIVSDTRGAGNQWRLTARTLGPLVNESGHQLENALVFVDANGVSTVLNPTDPVPIAENITQVPDEISAIQWSNDRGLLAHVNLLSVQPDTPYTVSIEWNLHDAP